MKYKFNRLERYIVWKTHDNACYWCGEPLSLKTCSIDHVIPEDSEDDIEKIKKDYELPANFVINGFCNWVPAHNNCNSKKGFELFKPSSVFLAILNDIIKKSIPAQQSYERLKNQNKIDDAIGKLTSIMEKDNISEKEIIEQLGYKIFEDEKIVDLGLQIPKGWKIIDIDKKKEIVTVSDGTAVGRTIIPPLDGDNPWWFCRHCGYYGPWTGSMCLTCGHYNDPND